MGIIYPYPDGYKEALSTMKQLEAFLEWGGTKKDVTCLVIGGLALLASIFGLLPLPFGGGIFFFRRFARLL